MQEILNAFIKYKWLSLGLLVLIALTVFMTIKAGRSVKKNRAEKEALIKKLDHMKMIRERYTQMTVDSIMADDGEFLLEGVASHIQLNIEKSGDMNEEFTLLNDEKKIVYALNYFLDDGVPDADKFFREYSYPLTPWALTACEIFLDEDANTYIRKLYDIFDEENNEVSYFEDEVKKIDDILRDKIHPEKLKKAAAEYIKEQPEKFLFNANPANSDLTKI